MDDALYRTVATQSDEIDFAEAFATSDHAKANDDAVDHALQVILKRRYEVESQQLARVGSFGRGKSRSARSGGSSDGGGIVLLVKQIFLQLRSGGNDNTFGGHIEARKHGGGLRAVGILLRYRTRSNYRSVKFLAQRATGAIIFSLVLTTMYWQQGGKPQDMANQLNIGSLLFMANVLPAYAAAGQMPSIVLERRGCLHNPSPHIFVCKSRFNSIYTPLPASLRVCASV